MVNEDSEYTEVLGMILHLGTTEYTDDTDLNMKWRLAASGWIMCVVLAFYKSYWSSKPHSKGCVG